MSGGGLGVQSTYPFPNTNAGNQPTQPMQTVQAGMPDFSQYFNRAQQPQVPVQQYQPQPQTQLPTAPQPLAPQSAGIQNWQQDQAQRVQPQQAQPVQVPTQTMPVQDPTQRILQTGIAGLRRP